MSKTVKKAKKATESVENEITLTDRKLLRSLNYHKMVKRMANHQFKKLRGLSWIGQGLLHTRFNFMTAYPTDRKRTGAPEFQVETIPKICSASFNTSCSVWTNFNIA